MALLEGRTALITGAAQGIGYAIAKELHATGACVVLADLDLGLATEAAGRLHGHGKSSAVRCDVTSEDDVKAALAQTVERHGRIDILVNNAVITRDKTMRTMTPDDFRAVIDVSLYGAWLGTKHASLIMREHGTGSIVNISSISGKVGMIGQTNYSAAKAGMVGLTKAAAKEVAHAGVRVNAVQPGLIRTPMTDTLPQRILDAKLAEIPMGRAGEASEVASVVLFLASYVTGTVIEVTGGRHI